ncbi:hypothetical protein [Thioflexithrix psekupsensis]|uniref:Glycosyltransferase RgtA/B/C/D-like domain-containing protein n=1 Tax=Thioflexithrix psekupsensis TaxID=1570016 RepID=A0A251X7K0_9GAMM|nr:hypothetical protein [Thioflexithrix psekupsensis]OUD14039.1 hypothetical protein TPSD3_06785 [Thioflexithrix psekupsensis]
MNQSVQLDVKSLIIYGLLFILLWLSLIKLGGNPSIDLDPSWMLVLAHAFQHHWQAGVDYIFTYGPLGYFANPYAAYYDKVSFNYFIIWSVASSFVLAGLFLIRFSQLPYFIEKVIYLFLLIFILGTWTGDALYFLTTVAITVLLLEPPHFFNQKINYIILLAFSLLILAILPLLKFSFFLLSGMAVIGILIHVWHKYHYQWAIFGLLFFVASFLTLWLISGQSIFNIADFLLNSWQIASYYDQAMSKESSEVRLNTFDATEYYFAVAGIVTLTILIALTCCVAPKTLKKGIAAAIILCGLFLTWKAGFIRHDSHSIIFFCSLMLLPFFVNYPAPISPSLLILMRGLLFATALMGLLGLFYAGHLNHGYHFKHFMVHWHIGVIDNLKTLSSLNSAAMKRDIEKARLQRHYDFPQVRAAVGQARVDIFSPHQGILLLHSFHYQARPIFQGYSAYNKSLLSLNALSYVGDKAPEFVLFKITPIDGRFPLIEDSQVLRILLRDYRPILLEKGFLLLKRDVRGTGLAETAPVPLMQKTVSFNEPIDITHLKDKALLLRLDIELSFWGQWVKLLFKLPEVSLVVQTDSGNEFTYRVVPSMAKMDFMFNPLVKNEEDWLLWHLQQPLEKINSFHLTLRPQWSFDSTQLMRLFYPEIKVYLSENETTPHSIPTP